VIECAHNDLKCLRKFLENSGAILRQKGHNFVFWSDHLNRTEGEISGKKRTIHQNRTSWQACSTSETDKKYAK
jgi:hypothetical protein